MKNVKKITQIHIYVKTISNSFYSSTYLQFSVTLMHYKLYFLSELQLVHIHSFELSDQWPFLTCKRPLLASKEVTGAHIDSESRFYYLKLYAKILYLKYAKVIDNNQLITYYQLQRVQKAQCTSLDPLRQDHKV